MKTWPSMKKEPDPQPDTEFVRPLILDVPDSRTVKKMLFVYIKPTQYIVFLCSPNGLENLNRHLSKEDIKSRHQICEKLLDITNHQRSVNQKHNEILLHAY